MMELWDSQRPWSTRLLLYRGTEVRVHATLWLLLAGILGWQLATASSTGGVAGAMGRVGYLGLFVGLVFGSILLHEAAHAACAGLFGHRTRGILLHPLGGLAFIDAARFSPKEDLAVSAAGPLVNLGIGGLLVLSADSGLLQGVGHVNVLLGVYNLFPLFPLDGGRILKSVLSLRRVAAGRKRQLTLTWSRVSAIVLAGLAVIQGDVLMLVCVGLLWVVAHAAEGAPIIPRREVGRLARRAGRGVRALATRAGLCVAIGAALALLSSGAAAEPVLTDDQKTVAPTMAPQNSQAEGQDSASPASNEQVERPLPKARQTVKRRRARQLSPNEGVLLSRLAMLERRLQRLLDATSMASTSHRLEAAAWLAHLRAELTDDIDHLSNQMLVVARELEQTLLDVQEAHSNDLTSLAARIRELEASAETSAASIRMERERRAMDSERQGEEIRHLLATLRQAQEEHFSWQLRFGSAVVGISVLFVLLAWLGRARERRVVRNLSANVRRRLPTQRSPVARTPLQISQPNECGAAPVLAVPTGAVREDSACLREPPAESRWLAPGKQLAELLTEAAEDPKVSHKPRLGNGPWNLGFVTHVGPVRQENQDYALAFEIKGHQVLIAADGVGGAPHGRLASQLAATAAARAIISRLGAARGGHSDAIDQAAMAGVDEAARILRRTGSEFEIEDVLDGLRTTLIVAVGTRKSYAYAYIGDGGGCVLRRDGSVESFVDPQKAGGATNVLAASLGPAQMGSPVAGTLARNKGDLLIVGTDGVFDRTDQSFPKTVMMAAFRNGGLLQDAAETLVEELAAHRDEEGHVFDDNVTLCLMAGKQKPDLSDGFWEVPKMATSLPAQKGKEEAQCR